MKKLKLILPLFAFIAGIFAAFATAPDATLDTYRLVEGQWEIVPATYYCKNAPDQICTTQFDNNDPETGQMINTVHGEFSLTP